MSVVHIDVRELSGLPDNYVPEDGQVWLSPFLAYVVDDGDDDYLVSTEILKLRLVDGVVDVDLPETPVNNLMKVQLRGVRGYGAPWYVQIPGTDCNLFDLTHIDPDTLDPLPATSPYWRAEFDAEVQDRIDGDETLTTGLDVLTDVVAALELGAASDSAVATQVGSGPLTMEAVDVTTGNLVDTPGTDLEAAVAAKIVASTGVGSIDFTSKVAVPTESDTGQEVNVTGSGTWRINHNALTLATGTGTKAAYLQYEVNGDNKITAMHRRFRINSTGSTDGMGMAVIAWEGLFVGPLPESHCHAELTRTGWVFDILTGGAIVPIASGTFAALSLDTVYETSITFSGDTATWLLPDGTVQRITDPRIGSIRGNVAVDELLATNLATDRQWEILESVNLTSQITPAAPPPSVWEPSHDNMVAANADPSLCGYGAALATIVTANRLFVPAGHSFSNVLSFVTAAGSGNTYARTAVFEEDGTQAGITGSLITAWSTTGAKTSPLGGTVAAKAYDRFVWVADLITGGTPPQLLITGVPGTFAANAGLGAVGYLKGGYWAAAEPMPSTLPVNSLVDYYQYWHGLA